MKNFTKIIVPVNSSSFCFFANSEEEVDGAINELQKKLDKLFSEYGLTIVGCIDFKE